MAFEPYIDEYGNVIYPEEEWPTPGGGPYPEPPTFDPNPGGTPITDILDEWKPQPTPTTTLPPRIDNNPPDRPAPDTPPPGGGGGGGGGNVPGTTEYPIPGGKTSFSYPDFAPAPFDYPDFAPEPFGIGKFEAPAATAGEWKAPSWDVGAPPTLTEFDYPEFTGPTAETFQTDPGYEFRAKEMERALKNDRSARGLLATGGTLQDLMSIRGSLASQEFGNVYNRQLGAHQENRSAAAAEHDRNEQAKLKSYELLYGAESDEYKRAANDYATKRSADDANFGRSLAGYQTNYAGEQDKFTRGLTTYLTGYGRKADDWNREKDIYGTNLAKSAGEFGLNLDLGKFNLARDDSRWQNLLGLYNISSRTLPTYQSQAPPPY